MPYLNVENWNHCQEFVDYLYRFHLEEQASARQERRPPNSTQLDELLDQCKQIHQRSYATRLYNLYAGESEYSHDLFTKQVVEWMNDKKFLQDPSVKYPYAVKFDKSFAPNLANVFENRYKNLIQKKGKFDDMIPENARNFWRRINQPSWQKNLIWLSVGVTVIMASLATVGILPAVSIFGLGMGVAFLSSMSQFTFGVSIGLSVTGAISYILDTVEKSNQDSGLYRQQQTVQGITNPNLTSTIEAHQYKPLKKDNPPKSKNTNQAATPLFSIDNESNLDLSSKENQSTLGYRSSRK